MSAINFLAIFALCSSLWFLKLWRQRRQRKINFCIQMNNICNLKNLGKITGVDRFRLKVNGFWVTRELSEKFLPRSGFPGFTLPAARSGLADRSDILLLKAFHQGGLKAGLRGSYTLKYTFSLKKTFFRTWRFGIPDQLQIVSWNDFAVITPWITFKFEKSLHRWYIATPIATVVYSLKVHTKLIQFSTF